MLPEAMRARPYRRVLSVRVGAQTFAGVPSNVSAIAGRKGDQDERIYETQSYARDHEPTPPSFAQHPQHGHRTPSAKPEGAQALREHVLVSQVSRCRHPASRCRNPRLPPPQPSSPASIKRSTPELRLVVGCSRKCRPMRETRVRGVAAVHMHGILLRSKVGGWKGRHARRPLSGIFR